MAPYDINTYLLDRENIKDTIYRMMFAFDDGSNQTLIDHVYPDKIALNYDKRIIGDGPETVTIDEWLKRLDVIHEKYPIRQHTMSNLLVELPQPSANAARPTQGKARAYVHALLYKADDQDRPRGLIRRNGVHFELDLVRLQDKGEGVNPWRVAGKKVRLDWQDEGSA